VPVIATPSLQRGEFIVGNFQLGAQLIDRLDMEVLISSEHADFFTKNMLMVRAEERVALAVKRPQALVFGEFPVEGTGT
jgi:HK97 family phage major capsid protein